MTEGRPERVRVSGPPRRPHGGPRQPRRHEIDEETRLGEIYLSSLLREQLRLAALTLLALAVLIGTLPLLFMVLPGLTDVRVLSVPLPWLLIGILVYPLLVILGWLYVRAAEQTESDFSDLVDTVEGP